MVERPKGSRTWWVGGVVALILALGSVLISFPLRRAEVGSATLSSESPQAEPRGQDRPTANAALDAEIRRAWAELGEGQVAFVARRGMRQGVAETVEARVAARPIPGITEGLERATVLTLRTSGVMQAELLGAPSAFLIEPLSESRQLVAQPFTAWRWVVTPLASGPQTLHLRLTARLRLSDDSEEVKDVLVREAEIDVAVDQLWVARRFVAQHWQWLLGSPLVLGLAAWVVARVRKREPGGGAGFR